MTSVVWIRGIFENIFLITQFLLKSCWFGYDQHFFFKYFMKKCYDHKDIAEKIKMSW